MIRLLIVVTLSYTFSLRAFASLVPPEHRSHCDIWEKGKCVKGKLSELAENMAKSFESAASLLGPSETCDRVCKEGCPNCSKCSLCSFCGWYNDQACVGVPYYKNRESCEEGVTKNCCDLCKVQCNNNNGVCGEKGYCNGGGPESDLMSYCVEQTTDDQCMPCSDE